MDIFFNESAQELLKKLEREPINNVGGVFFENSWWVAFRVVDNDFDFDQFLCEKSAINFVKGKKL